jgi:CRISPR-associated protein Cas1
VTAELQNVLYVQTDGSYLRLEHDNVVVSQARVDVLRVPLHHLTAIVAIGRVSLTSPLLARCATDGRSVVQMSSSGRFLYRIEGRRSGNVLLRTAQFAALNDPTRPVPIAQALLAGKLANARQVVLRSGRETSRESWRHALQDVGEDLLQAIRKLPSANTLNEVRGIEGAAAKRYFEVLPLHLRVTSDEWKFDGRNRRPPRDRVNALLSFVYAILTQDCVSALEAVGLDPQAGFLHALRPGRPSLALDLMEELRPILGDRVAFTLINKRQVQADDFDLAPGGAVTLNESGRRAVIAAYQERKRDVCIHPLLRERVALGLVPLVQARLLARAVRRDHVTYVPFFYK